MDTKAKILEVLSKGHLMSLATQDDGGVWVSDVIYVHDEVLNIYWMSSPAVRHSQAILNNSSVAGTITVTVKVGEPNLGIQFSGRAEKIQGPRYDLATKHFTRRDKEVPAESEDVLAGGNKSWYVIHPAKIELIDEENLGYKKTSLEIPH